MDGTIIEKRSGFDPQAAAAREAEITGKPQRIEALAAEQVDDEGLEIIARLRGPSPAGSEIPAFHRTMIKNSQVLLGLTGMGKAISTGKVPPRERELAVLRVCWLLGAPYAWGEHVVIGKRCGVSPEEIERVVQGSAAPGWSDHDAAILRGVEELLSNQTISDETWSVLAAGWNEAQLIELPLIVGHYVGTACLQNSLRMRLGPGNTGLTSR
jgi:alkylhydroperoxidase family enzyme